MAAAVYSKPRHIVHNLSNRPFRLEFYCFHFNSLHHESQERRPRLPNVFSPAGRQNNGPRGEGQILWNRPESPGLRFCPRRVTVLPRFCRLCPRVTQRFRRAVASMKGKSKDRRKQIIRVLLLNGVHEQCLPPGRFSFPSARAISVEKESRTIMARRSIRAADRVADRAARRGRHDRNTVQPHENLGRTSVAWLSAAAAIGAAGSSIRFRLGSSFRAALG